MVAAREQQQAGPFYAFEVDGVEFRWDEATITGAQIMELAGIPQEVGLVLLHDDGTQETIAPERVIELEPGRRIKKRPRFQRG